MPSKSIPIEARVVANRTISSLAGWRVTRLRSALQGPLAVVATGATFPVAVLWARLHEAAGWPAWALTPTDCLRRGVPEGAQVLFLSASGRHHDILQAAQHVPKMFAVVCDRSAPLCDMVRSGGGDAFILPRPPAPTTPLLADPLPQIPLITLAAAVYDAPTAGLAGLDGPLPSLPDRRPQHVLALGAGLAQPAAEDFAARCRESGIATARVSDLRNVAHGELMSIRPDATWMVHFALSQDAAYVERYCAALPPELARTIVSASGGVEGAVSLMHLSGRLAMGAMARFDAQPTVKDLPDWLRTLYRLAQ